MLGCDGVGQERGRTKTMRLEFKEKGNGSLPCHPNCAPVRGRLHKVQYGRIRQPSSARPAPATSNLAFDLLASCD